MPRKSLEDDENGRIAAMLRAAGPLPDAGVMVGPGDDCAVVHAPKRGLVLKTDAVVEMVHYTPETMPAQVGWKAAARVVSDFAAMGAQPRHALITIGMERDRESAWAKGVYRGLGKCARRFGFTIAGGETTRVPVGSFLVVAMTGEAGRRTPLRGGGQPGDVLAVTGRLGGSIRGRHLRFEPRLAEGQWLAGQAGVRAMMDLSDGLTRDLPRLAAAGGCGYSVEATLVPCSRGCTTAEAMGDGEDYELLLAVDPLRWSALHAAWRQEFPRLSLTRIGALETPEFASGLEGEGYDHFA